MEELPLDVVRKIMRYVSHPVADLVLSKFDEYEYARCVECDQCRSGGEDPCTCPVLNTSKAEDLYLVTDPSYKLEKILELKVIMNWLERNMDTTDRKPKNLDIEWRGLQEWYPTFCHCNKDIIYICFNMLIRNVELDLNKYEQLYDQFY